MSKKRLLNISYAYLILPIIIFVMGWCKIFISIPIVAMLGVIYYILYKQNCDKNNDEIVVSNNWVLVVFLIVFFICILGGHGGLYYQSSDWDARNAIFRDLINFDWPVYYERTNTSLVYYIAQWMVPALVGKIFSYISYDFAWFIGNMMLLLWNTLGITICLLWLINKLNVKKRKEIIVSILMFLFFSGLDIIGVIIFNRFDLLFQNLHLEWWARYISI